MKREIKFRVWDNDAEAMIYSDKEDGDYWWEFRPIRCGCVTGSTGGSPFEPPEPIVTYYENVMQFTGLKDKNGKEIYEGDIIQTDTILQYVDYNESLALYGVRQFSGGGTMSIDKAWEVIGNIYENPELL